jgi:peptidylprolyl isomerase
MKQTIYIGGIVAVLLVIMFGIKYYADKPNEANRTLDSLVEVSIEEEDGVENTMVILKTNLGDIGIELFTEDMPITTSNFIKLANSGFYNGTKFHRVIGGFMVQGGDPLSKENDTALYGTGGPGYTIEDEFVDGRSNVRGTIAMANTGQANSGGSQFFINLADNTNLDFDKEPLSSKHPVFGRVVSGMEVVDAIAKVATSARDIPVEPVVIEDVVVE